MPISTREPMIGPAGDRFTDTARILSQVMGRMDCDGSDANRAQSAEISPKLPGKYPELTKSTPDVGVPRRRAAEEGTDAALALCSWRTRLRLPTIIIVGAGIAVAADGASCATAVVAVDVAVLELRSRVPHGGRGHGEAARSKQSDRQSTRQPGGWSY